MKRLYLKILLIIISFIIFTANAQNSYATHPLFYEICGVNVYNTVNQLITKDFPNVFIIDYYIEAVNDAQCVEPEYMANILIVFRGSPASQYGIFHIHFLPTGELKSAAGFTQWKPFKKRREWKDNWCDIIKSVYPRELKEQGCAL